MPDSVPVFHKRAYAKVRQDPRHKERKGLLHAGNKPSISYNCSLSSQEHSADKTLKSVPSDVTPAPTFQVGFQKPGDHRAGSAFTTSL